MNEILVNIGIIFLVLMIALLLLFSGLFLIDIKTGDVNGRVIKQADGTNCVQYQEKYYKLGEEIIKQ